MHYFQLLDLIVCANPSLSPFFPVTFLNQDWGLTVCPSKSYLLVHTEGLSDEPTPHPHVNKKSGLDTKGGARTLTILPESVSYVPIQ